MARSASTSSAMNRRRVIVSFQLSEDVFDFGEQALALRFVLDAGERTKLFHQLTLALVELGWGLKADFDDQVAFAMTTQYRNAFAFHAQGCSGLCPLRHFQDVIAIEGRNCDFCAA